MIRIAWKNLTHDRARLVISLVGVAFAVFLMLVQGGIYLGFTRSASAVIDHCPADLWIVAPSTTNLESAWAFSEDELAAVRGAPGVAWAERFIHAFGCLKLASGEGRWCQIIGFDPATGRCGPWEMVVGRIADLKKPGTYVVDESSLPQLEGLGVGDRLENLDHKMELVGLCRGAKSYTTNPMLFASYATAQRHSPLHREKTSAIVAKIEPEADVEATVERLRRLTKFEVLRREDFSRRTRDYWSGKTGIGIGIGITAALGFIVGLVIVGQTMYASTIERLREYATLKALGATNLEVCSMIWLQALLLALGGYAAGALGAAAARRALAGQVIAMHLDVPIFLLMLVTTLLMCLGASLLSTLRILKVDPAVVFRS